MQLNPEQKRAVTTTEGPVLVLAGAGTGKTKVITVRIAHLLGLGVPPDRILAVTFTNKAAREMRERVRKIVKRNKAKDVTIGTFHAFCAKTLRTHGERIGIPANFAICDGADQLSAAKSALRELCIPEAKIHPRALQSQISLMKNRLITSEACLKQAVDDQDELVGRAYEKYNAQLKRARTLDFDDLLLQTLALLTDDPATLELYRDRYRYLMVDEYQDTNGPQYEIVKMMAGERRNLCVVGDDDQSIYSWRGADVKKILTFERDFPGCVTVRLETNYRSTQPILDAANRVISCNPARHEKTLRSHVGAGEPVRLLLADDEEKEALAIVGDIRQQVLAQKARFKDFAVLFRAAAQSRAFEAELRRHDVPYLLVGGQSFFDRKEVRDVLAYLKLVANPDDEVSFLRIVNTPPRGVGKTAVQRALDFATRNGIGAAAAFDRADEIENLPRGAAEAVARLRGVLRATAHEPSLVALVKEVIECTDYYVELVRCYPEALQREARWNGVQEILNFAENFQRRDRKATLASFLEALALTATDDSKDDKGPDDAVTLMTLHAAKGLEFPFVFLVGVEEGLLPHVKSSEGDQVEEERRLMYVGITRARERLVVSHVKTRARHGRRVECMPSRFVFELKGEAVPEGWCATGAGKGKKKTRRARTR